VKEYKVIVVGNVSSSKLAKTKISQEVLKAKGKSMGVEARADEKNLNKDSGEKLSMAGPGIRPHAERIPCL